MKRVGVYSGTFDPVHHGHLAFIDDAMKHADLERVLVLPEPQPRRRQTVSGIQHRMDMLHLATDHNDRIDIVLPPHQQFSVRETLPWLQNRHPDATLHFLIGSDFFDHLEAWPDIRDLLQSVEFVVAARDTHDQEYAKAQAARIGQKLGVPIRLLVLDSRHPSISSTGVRHALRHGFEPFVPSAVADYARTNKLYA